MFSSVEPKLCSHICMSVHARACTCCCPPFWMPVLVHKFRSVAFCIYRHVCCQYLSCPLMCPLLLHPCFCFYCVDFQCLLVVTVAQYTSVKLASYCDDCSINLGAHRGVFESSSLFIVSLVGHWTPHRCVPICSERRSACRQLFKGSIHLSLVARSCSPEQLFKENR